MSVTYNINDRYCPKGHTWTFAGSTTLFVDCYYCKDCGKIYRPTFTEVSREYFEKHYNTDRFNDIVNYAAILDARTQVTKEDLIKLGYLKT